MGGQVIIHNMKEDSVCESSDSDSSSISDEVRKPFYEFRDGNHLGFMIQLKIPFAEEHVEFFSSRQNQKAPSNDRRQSIYEYAGPCCPIDATPSQRVKYHGESIRLGRNDIKREVVMIVDDDKVNLKILYKILQQSGYKEIIAASDGQEASLLFQKYYDRLIIILTDLQMPVTGFELASKVRGFEKNLAIQPAIPIVAISAAGQESSVEADVLKAQMQALIVKPVSKAGIQQLMQKWAL